MSETPETDASVFDAEANGIIYKVVFAAFASQLKRERNSLQDQRDFAMGEIERLRKETAHKDKLLREMRAAIRWAAEDIKPSEMFDGEKLRHHAKEIGLREHLTTQRQ